MNDKPLKDRFSISSDELHHRMELQDQYHDKPLMNVASLIDEAIQKVLRTLGVDISGGGESIKLQQTQLGITITEHPPEQMGELSGFYIQADYIPVAIIKDPYLASDGLAYLDILWIRGERLERFGGVRIIQ